ncbi:MAG: hypothetical protein JWP49_453 [Phenylobacterium sp.]|nr:hypothetical protein [Phenylobacterium sp.]
MQKPVAALAIASVLLASCASSSESIQGSYVSPIQYSNLDCDQLRGELLRVSTHVHEVAGAQDKKHRNDQVAMGVGMVLFWPALFFLMGGDQKAELQRLKGEYEALDQASIQKKCSMATEMHPTSTTPQSLVTPVSQPITQPKPR